MQHLDLGMNNITVPGSNALSKGLVYVIEHDGRIVVACSEASPLFDDALLVMR